MEQLLLDMMQKYPNLMSAFVVMGVLRAVFKPLMTVFEAYVVATPSKDDDSLLAKVKASKSYALVAYVLDYAASIKLPK